MTVYICAQKDIVCGDNPANWCLGCPKRGLLQVAVAPHAGAHHGPTLMRPATPEEHSWLRRAVARSSTRVAHPAAEALVNACGRACIDWAQADPEGVQQRYDEMRAARMALLSALGVALPDGRTRPPMA